MSKLIAAILLALSMLFGGTVEPETNPNDNISTLDICSMWDCWGGA